MQTHLFMILYHPLRQCLKMGVGISVHLIFHSHLCLMQTMQISKIPKSHRRNRIKVVQLLLPSQNWTKRDKKKLKKKRKENLQFRRYRSFDKIAYFLWNFGNC